MPKIHRPVRMSRPELNAVMLQEKYGFKTLPSENVLRDAKNYLKKNYRPDRGCMTKYLYKRIPFLKWIQTYDVRSLLLNDLIGGFTVGVINIPQGLAYSQAAGLHPINGLYVTFITSLVYMFLGTSRNISMGTYGIVSLLIGSVTQDYSDVLYPDAVALGANDTIPDGYISTDPNQGRLMVVTALAFFTGIIQIILAIIHAGVSSKYLSDVVIAAFTTGAAYHVVTNQLNILLGIKLPANTSFFTLIANYYDLFRLINQTNIASLVISIISLLCLYLVKHFINHRYQHKLIAPIPIELIVVIFATLFSYLFNFNSIWKVPIVGPVPEGFPAPSLPYLQLFSSLIGSSITIAVVSFAVNLSMAKVYAKQFNYHLHPNQEAFAYGVGNVIASFFSCFPSCVGLSRTVVLVGTKSKTQLHSIFSNSILLIVITLIGFVFSYLPNCVLASITVVALINMLIEVRQILPIYRRSKLEAMAWIATFAGILLFDIDYGLYIGIGVSILLVIIQSQRATTTVLGNIPKTDIYEDIKVTSEAREIEGIKIIRYEASLYYANVENFTYKVQKLTGVKSDEILETLKNLEIQYKKQIKKIKAKNAKKNKKPKKPANDLESYVLSTDEPNQHEHEEKECTIGFEAAVDKIYSSIPIKDIILDCSSMNQIDSMGVDTLVKLNSAYNELGVTLRLTHCKSSLFRIFEKLGFKDKFDYSHIYPTTHDAVLYTLGERRGSDVRLSTLSVVEDTSSGSQPSGTNMRNSGQARFDQLDSIVNLDAMESIYVDVDKLEYDAFREIADEK